MHILVHAHELARNRDEQADGLLGNFDRVAARGVADFYTELLGSREIHPVDADAGAADDFGFLELRDDFLGERDRAVHDDPVRVAAHFDDLRIVGGPRDHQLRVDLIKDRFDEIDWNIVAAEVFDPKFSHCFSYAPNPKVLVGLSQRILRRDSAEILLLPLIAPTVLSGNLSMASLCG